MMLGLIYWVSKGFKISGGQYDVVAADGGGCGKKERNVSEYLASSSGSEYVPSSSSSSASALVSSSTVSSVSVTCCDHFDVWVTKWVKFGQSYLNRNCLFDDADDECLRSAIIATKKELEELELCFLVCETD
ncbi:hypothetical protein Tco_0468676 [Tanacetum coccineum]